MKYRRTKRVAISVAVVWLCLLIVAIVVRIANVEIGSVQPEAVVLIFMMTLPFQLVLMAVIVGAVALIDRSSGRGNKT